ncbi:hypothetical protein CcaverHIS002_0108690 [Cutaneotrichosporon cavernicola]|uniref:Fumarylacetoacetase n=1 Tax=Cutaneotrichosporon cavernicola TaxID=279322 RepID=A0AA48KZ13_9TREE|nr:uncharacterized protein CcaverHIS019_0108640 [Cutaneotrichosporon cavernicola]BEI80340.1 hypothetical protein CcaverHIS002_0108690 [Cutaneotrichosporon cavernicola]BEI88146.1 hypothetical protein CcaverHIS019_0108640 [Cutaneotrichosporon cavernicola]BEI95916.1 hypothetical protein CcaverHIS631_0108650 [Cutaneotrichosporon cavernicola]BEJ03691.1 hypothetical protein CcaverHIS641_0108660 [Cutaneotrichosporon cavernicola]
MPGKSFVQYSPDSPFPIENCPYGVFSTADKGPRPGVAIGDKILDLDALSRTQHWAKAPVPAEVVQKGTLDALAARDPEEWVKFRSFVQETLGPNSPIAGDASLLVNQKDATMHMPITIGDYTDFYASYEHAFNCGVLFRDPKNAIQPNWKHLPVGYHGRASSVVISGTPFHRPVGQILDKPGDKQPIFSPCRKLDYELEMGVIYGGKETKLGERLSPAECRRRTFGLVILNDWSARDIQAWEYVPLGPFLSKNFCTSISPWVVNPAALEPFKTKQYEHEFELLPYLQDKDGFNYDIPLKVEIKPEGEEAFEQVSLSNTQHLYYTFAQMWAHHSCTGCRLRPSDMLGSGTISAPRRDGLGSLLEKSNGGKDPYTLGKRNDMTFLRDGDVVRMSAVAQGDGYCIGFGAVEGQVLPPYEQ